MIRRALLSVSDKTGLVDLARALHASGVELLSTGGTLATLRAAGIEVTSVEAYTGSPEVMDGRVKTLHPRVHGGLLAREGRDEADLQRLGATPIDLVVVNLYPFEATVARRAPHEEIVENIDIGGPSMLRSAAKNHARVTVVCDPVDYAVVTASLPAPPPKPTRARLAAKVFAHTAAYDGAIAAYLSGACEAPSEPAASTVAPMFSPDLMLPLERVATLRYGENPHQRGAFYRDRGAPRGSLARAESVDGGGKELSFNNLVDVDAALEVVRELDGPGAAIIKHTNPCGLATHSDLAVAYRLAREGDPLSAFGGVVALNRPCDEATARVLAETFIECVVAPEFEPSALTLLRAKKNLRLVRVGLERPPRGLEWKRVGGGFVVQDADVTAPEELRGATVVTERHPSSAELASLEVAWRACKHVKSNAIVLAQPAAGGHMLVGVGAGQMSRVQSVLIACDKAGERARGSVLASDAFFPFPDGVEAAAARGIAAIAQPGGSVKDPDVIAAANAHGIAMIFTAVRHFRH
ncbi:MAG: bifunctional phosphoribosylaminoimidazolecarboxamide formyltransferase/IMP cyclohydrolase [Deltaproteobacteria bacterium]|nr:bifunctional phosphoribosylaminoimidazolecarboxamide formyltransferase/IMP cyclohydrolase [Deltaproteobacteria bacterium]